MNKQTGLPGREASWTKGTDTPLTPMKRPSSKSSPRKNGSSNTQTLTSQTVVLAVRGGDTECTDTGCLITVYRYGSKSTGIPEPTQGAELSLSVSLSLSRTHMHVRAHAHARAHTHAHTLCTHFTPPPSDVSFPLLLPTRHLVFLPSLSLSIAPANMPLAAQQGTL